MKNYVVGFVIDKNRSLVMLIEKNKPEWQKGFLNGVGGKIEDYDDSPAFAMQRECLEETGLNINYDEWVLMGSMVRQAEFNTLAYYAYHDDIMKARSMESEQVKILSIRQVILGREKTLHNIPLLLQACLMFEAMGEASPTINLKYI